MTENEYETIESIADKVFKNYKKHPKNLQTLSLLRQDLTNELFLYTKAFTIRHEQLQQMIDNLITLMLINDLYKTMEIVKPKAKRK